MCSAGMYMRGIGKGARTSENEDARMKLNTRGEVSCIVGCADGQWPNPCQVELEGNVECTWGFRYCPVAYTRTDRWKGNEKVICHDWIRKV